MPEVGIKVLLVEDDAQIRRFVRTALESGGLAVHETATGRGGLEAAAARKPDMLILDLGLPDMDGLQVVTQLREC